SDRQVQFVHCSLLSCHGHWASGGGVGGSSSAKRESSPRSSSSGGESSTVSESENAYVYATAAVSFERSCGVSPPNMPWGMERSRAKARQSARTWQVSQMARGVSQSDDGPRPLGNHSSVGCPAHAPSRCSRPSTTRSTAQWSSSRLIDPCRWLPALASSDRQHAHRVQSQSSRGFAASISALVGWP